MLDHRFDGGSVMGQGAFLRRIWTIFSARPRKRKLMETGNVGAAMTDANVEIGRKRCRLSGMTDTSVHTAFPDAEAGALLAGAQFIDAYSVTIQGAALNARQAAEKMLQHQPRWVRTLMTLRDLFVRPFGLKTAETARRAAANRVGFFPVLGETPHRIVAGLNDRHLDFRVVVAVMGSGTGQSVTATTVVLTHNWLGRTYLAIILPFHRLIVRSMLRQVAG
jgi:hypothetical protein